MIFMMPTAFVDMVLAVLLCPVEISGLGKIRKETSGDFVIEEINIPDQECSFAGTEFDPESIGRYWTKLLQEGRGEEINDLHFWWHSHPFGQVLFSQTDEYTIKGFGEGTLDEWWVSAVLNKLGDINLRVDYFRPRRSTEYFRKVKLTEKIEPEALELLENKRLPHVKEQIAVHVKIMSKDDYLRRRR